MASEQEDLLKALRGNSGREQVNVEFGQVGLRPTIERGGQYQVQVQSTPRSNSALQLAEALQGGSQLLNNFVNVQSKQGEIEANALSPAEVVKAIEQGDPKAKGFLASLGKEKTFTENVWKRYYKSTVSPAIQKLENEFRNTSVEGFAGQSVTTDDDMRAYALSRINDVVAPFREHASKNPYASTMNNMALEEIIPQFVEGQVATFSKGVSDYNINSTLENQISLAKGVNFGPDNNIKIDGPPAGAGDGTNGPTGSDFDPASLGATRVAGFPGETEEDINAALDGLDVESDVPVGDVSPAQGSTVNDASADLLPPLPGQDEPADLKKQLDEEYVLNPGVFNAIQNTTDTNNENLKKAGVPGYKRMQYAREGVDKAAKEMMFNGKFAEAQILLEQAKNIKLGGQNIWGSQNGQLEIAGLQDSLDTYVDREYANNERDLKKQIDDISAPLALALRLANPDKLDALAGDTVLKVGEMNIPDSVKLGVIAEIDNMRAKLENKEFTAATRDDAETSKNQEASSLQQAALGNSVQKDFAAYAATNPTLSNWAVGYNAEKMVSEVRPEAQLKINEEYVNVATELSPLNYDMTQMIENGTAFEYEVGGEKIQFPASTTKQEKDALYVQLGNAHRKDLKYRLDTRLEAIANADAKLTETKENNLPPRVKEENAIVKDLVSKGVSEGRAKEEARKQIQQQYGANSLVQKDGNIKRGPGVFENSSDMVGGYINDVKSKVYADTTKAEEAFLVAKYHSNISSRNLVKAIDSNPIAAAKELDDLNNQFKEVGIPWDAVKSGYVTFDKPTFEVTTSGDPSFIRGYYAIDSLMKQENSESNYQLIPLNILKNRTKPGAVGSLQSVADRWYGGDVKGLVAGQLKWYANRGIEIK